MRGAELAGRAEDVTLARLGEPRPDGQHVVGAERQRPAGARIAFGDGQHRPPERGQAERVAAELARLQDPVEAGLGELPAELGRVMPEPFGLVLLGADGRDQRPGSFDDRLRPQARLRDGDFLGSHVGMPWHKYEPAARGGRRQAAMSRPVAGAQRGSGGNVVRDNRGWRALPSGGGAGDAEAEEDPWPRLLTANSGGSSSRSSRSSAPARCRRRTSPTPPPRTTASTPRCPRPSAPGRCGSPPARTGGATCCCAGAPAW